MNIDYLVLSYTEKENHYVFEQTLRVLKDEIIKVDKRKKVVVFPNFTIRFCCDEEYERNMLHTLRAKELGGRWFERQLDNYEELKRRQQ